MVVVLSTEDSRGRCLKICHAPKKITFNSASADKPQEMQLLVGVCA